MKKYLIQAFGTVLSQAVNGWMSTLDYQVAYYDPKIDPAYPSDGQKRIYVFWHEYLQLMIYLRKNCNISMLISQHADANILENVAKRFGYGVVRGSSRRGGAQALCQMLEVGHSKNLTLVPDGPRGPRRRVAPGCVYLASRLQIPLVLLGIGFDRPHRLKSWDRFAIPRLGSRARIVVSGDVCVPPHLNREGLEHFRVKIEELLNFLSWEAEDWAKAGDSYENEANVLSGPKSSMLYFTLPKPATQELDRTGLMR